jgi:hypothetical protein
MKFLVKKKRNESKEWKYGERSSAGHANKKEKCTEHGV